VAVPIAVRGAGRAVRPSHRRLDGRPSVGKVLIDESARGSVHLGGPPRQIRLAGVGRFNGCRVLLGRLRRRGHAGRARAAEQHGGDEEARPKAMHARSVTGRQVACKRRPNRIVGMPDRDFPKVPDHQPICNEPLSAFGLRCGEPLLEVMENCGLNGRLVLGKAQLDEQLFKSCEVGDSVKSPLEGRHQPRGLRPRQDQASIA